MADYLRDISPVGDIFSRQASPILARAASRREQAPYLNQEEEQSVIGSLRDKTLTTLGAVGNLLDIPGSMVRDVASSVVQGKFVNPFDQLISPLSSENRTTGQDLLRQAGMAGPRDSWGKSIAGFGAEVALDPLSWVTLGVGGSVTKSMKALGKGATADDIVRVATKKAGAAPGSIGKREAMLNTTLRDVADLGTGRTQQAAKKALEEVSPEDASKPLGAMLGFGLPFATPFRTAGTGAVAQKVARGMDKTGRALRYGSIFGTLNPIGRTMRAFSAKTGGAATPEVAATFAQGFDQLPPSTAVQKEKAANQATWMARMLKDKKLPESQDVAAYLQSRPWFAGKNPIDFDEMDLSDAVREAQEYPSLLNAPDSTKGDMHTMAMPDSLKWIAEQHIADNASAPGRSFRAGQSAAELMDDLTNYSARFTSSGSKKQFAKDMKQSIFDPSFSMERKDYLKNVEGGTVALRRKIFMDPEVSRIIRDKEGVQALEDYLRSNHQKGVAVDANGNPTGWLDDEYQAFYKSGPNKGKPYMKGNRFGKMARMLYKQDPDVVQRGLFGNNVVIDHLSRMMSHTKTVDTAKLITSLITSKDQSGRARYIFGKGRIGAPKSKIGTLEDDTVSLKGFLQQMGMPEFTKLVSRKTGNVKKGGMYKVMAKELGIDIKDLRGARIDKRIAEDLVSTYRASRSRDFMDEIFEMTDPATNLFKGLQTTVFPAFHIRNVQSGWMQNAMLGMWSGESAKWANDLSQGRVMKGVKNIDWVGENYARSAKNAGWDDDVIVSKLKAAGFSEAKAKAFVGRFAKRRAASGRFDPFFQSPKVANARLADLDDELATNMIGRQAYADGVVGSVDSDRLSDLSGGQEIADGTIDELLTGVPRLDKKSFSPFRVASKALGREPGTSLNPLKMRGVSGTKTTFGPAVAGEEAGAYAESLVRLQPYIAMLKRGYSSDIAAQRTAAAQVAYSNRNFTPFELKYMTRLFPFYKFSRQQIPFQFKKLMERPGGTYGQAIRAQSGAQEQGELAPEYVRKTASIPVSPDNPILNALIGAAPEGTDRYVSGLGLMTEDMLSFGPGVRGTGLEVLSRMNPLIKGPLEYATGQSFFQAGPEGGRPLDEMDPLLGRIAANLTKSDEPVQLPGLLETIAANSPLSRTLTTIRTLTDPRKAGDYGVLSDISPVSLPGVPALINLASGARVTDISERAKDAVVRDLLEPIMKGAGARTFERVSFRKEDLAAMNPEERAAAIQLQALANVLARRSKEAAKKRKQQQQNQ